MTRKPMLAAAGLALCGLAACAIPNERANPDDASLLGDRLTVLFSNGVRCHVDSVSEQPAGQFTGCPVPAGYRIEKLRPGYLGTGFAEPYSDITITTADGRETLFKTPESRNWSARGLGTLDWRD